MTPTKAQTAAKRHQDDEHKRAKARKDFYRIVKERLDARLNRHETYTTSRDLYSGYEKLVREGFGDTPPSQIVSQVLGQKPYRGRLFYARHIATHKAERSGPGRTSPYRLYLRDDATPPRDYVLVPLDTPKDRIAQVIAEKRGSRDATMHVTNGQKTPLETPEQHKAPEGIPEGLVAELTGVIARQAALIAALTAACSAFASSTND